MKRKELIELYKRFNEIEHINGVEFSYKMNYNKKVIKDEIELIQSSFKTPVQYTDYLQKEKELIYKYAEKDEQGQIKQNQHENGNISVTINEMETFNKLHTELNEQYNESINEYVKLQQEYNTFLEEDYDTSKFKNIFFELIPDSITMKEMEILTHFIKE